MYVATQIILSDTSHWSYGYCDRRAFLAWKLYNAALFRIRQIFAGYGKASRTSNEQQVFDEVKLLESTYPSIKIKRVISYAHLEKLMRVTGNPDFTAGLPMQTAQAVVKQAVQDFKGWLSALRDYKRSPDKYLGKPRMPHYKKSPCTFTITNQDAVIYGKSLKLPGIKERLPVSGIPDGGTLKEVKVIPFYGKYILSMTFEADDIPYRDGHNRAAIDFGVDNIAAIVSTDGSSRLYKGGAILSENAYFAKQRAEAVGIIARGHKHIYADSAHLKNLSKHHECFVKDQLHKISRNIVDYCLSHDVDTLVLGDNRLWKQNVNIGAANNQKFVQVPIAKLKFMISYKASLAGIRIIYQEESYTSKASFIDGDNIPVYDKNDKEAHFSGKRIARGLYKAASGLIINADLNGAANILRKADPYAWERRACLSIFTDYSFLTTPEVFGFHELNPQSIPAKRIKAA
ncbi:MAG: transposase [Lachnospiraceae bacterium]|nr:transposase [Lachnospiraceae bacterium]